MSKFFLLLLLFVGGNNSILAQDYPSNLDSIIDIYRTNNQLPKAVAYFDKVLSKAEKEYGNQSDTFAFYLNYQAGITKELDHYEAAVELFKKVITIYEQNHSKTDIRLALPLDALATTYLELGKNELAKELLNRALEITQQVTPTDFATIATVYNSLSIAHRVSGAYMEALKLAQKALETQSKTTNTDIKVLIRYYNTIAGAYTELYDAENAIAIRKKVLHLQQRHFPPNAPELASTLNGLACDYDQAQRTNEALPYLQKAIEITRATKGDKSPQIAYYLNNLATFYINLKEAEKASPLALEAMHILSEKLGAEHPTTIIFINNVGWAYYNMQDFAQAKVYYQKATNLAHKILGEKHPYSLFFKRNLGSAQVNLKDYENALKLYSEVADISKNVFGSESMQVIISYNQIANCYRLLGPEFHSQALEWVERAITLNAIEPLETHQLQNNLKDFSSRTFKSNSTFQQSLKIRSEIQQAIYKNTNDQQYLLESYNTQKVLTYFIQHRQNTVYTRKDKLQTLGYLTTASSRAIDLLKDLETIGHPNIVSEAIAFAEYNKSAVLSSALQGNKAINFGEIPDSLKNRERTLKKEKDLVQKKIIQHTTNKDEEALNAATQELIDVQLEQDKLRQLLKENYPKYNTLKNEQKRLTTTIVQEQLLQPQSALLEYCIYDSAVYVIVITPSTVQLQKLPTQKNTLSAQIKDFRKSLSNYKFIVNHEKEAYVLYTQTAFDLHEVLIAPIQKHLSNIKQLIIVPDNDLGHIPFEPLLSTLPNQQIINYQNLDYLLYDYTIRYSYAASLLLENKPYKSGTNNGKILGFAASYGPNDSIASYRSPFNQQLRKNLDPLPAATQEIEILQEQFPNSDFFLGKEATEALFKEKAANYAVLHLAMHGITNNHYPLLSSLAFTEDYDTTENNFLEAHEISNLQLYNDLVVLSACKTGYGEFEQGEGIMSLARSFMYAGAPSLVVSLWEINDLSTAAIMQLFYQNLAKGMTKDEALRQVKLEYIERVDGYIAHPIFWSPFIVLGNNQPIHLKSTIAPWQWGAVGGGVALVGLLFLLVRKRIRQKNLA
ncbi:MAG: CHAT domain-containing protein [Aureispira sp.]